MTLEFCDYALLAATFVAAVFGALGGFSGSLAFLSATVVSAVAGRFIWLILPDYLSQPWSCALAELVLVLCVFGLVRLLVRHVVKGLLAQPADAIFGFLLGGITGLLLSGGALYLLNLYGFVQEKSNILQTLLQFIPIL